MLKSDGTDECLSEAARWFNVPDSELLWIRDELTRQPYIAFEEIESPPRLPIENLDDIVGGKWCADDEVVDIVAGNIPWDSVSRSASFHLHAWHPLAYLLMAYSDHRDERYMQIAVRYASIWAGKFQRERFAFPLEQSVRDCALSTDSSRVWQGSDGSSRAWHDMAVGQRVYRIAYILDIMSRVGKLWDPELFTLLFKSLIFHMELLSREDVFVSHNNHGIYQALGQLAASRRFLFLPEFRKYHELASFRLDKVGRRMFFSSGAHYEHSPAYHFMVLGTFIGARDSGLLENRDILGVVDSAEEALSWMVQPDGSFATIGDTDLKKIYRVDGARRFEDPKLQYVLSGGELGSPVSSGLKAYEDAGYVFARHLPEGRPERLREATYLAQIAGFHSRTHKHADHLSFVWMERGRSILTDPGRYGYAGKTALGDELSRAGFFYSDPKRIYVERTRAHNCVEIDGEDYPRKDVEPFGSAIIAAGEANGLAVTLCELRHPGGVRHVRLLVLLAGSFLVVVDWLKDRKEREHSFRQWFQLAPEWRPQAEGGILACTHAEVDAFRLRAASLVDGPELDRIRIGETEPEMSGWISDGPNSLVPSPSLNWHLPDARLARFATLFTLGGHLSVDRSLSFLGEDGAEGGFHWTDERGSHAVGFTRDVEGNSVTVEYRCEETGRAERVTARGDAAHEEARRLRSRIADLEDRLEDEGEVKADQTERLERFKARAEELERKLEDALAARADQAQRSERFKARAEELEAKLKVEIDGKAEQAKRADRFKARAEQLKAKLQAEVAARAEREERAKRFKARAAELSNRIVTMEKRLQVGGNQPSPQQAVVDAPDRLSNAPTQKLDALEQQLEAERKAKAAQENKLAAVESRAKALKEQLDSTKASVRFRVGSAIVDLPRHPLMASAAIRHAFATVLSRRLARSLSEQTAALAEAISRFGFDNTGARVETHASSIAASLNDAEARQALEQFQSGSPDKALALLCESSGTRVQLPAPASLLLRRAEAVMRVARSGLPLPGASDVPAYEPDPRLVFYITHMRAPIVSNGYVARTPTILAGLRTLGLVPVGTTRLGFPNDLAAYEHLHIGDEEIVEGTRFFALSDDQGGVRGRPIDEYVESYAARLVELARTHRPAVLHAASNYMNGLAAIIAGHQLGVPVIYEARGLWQLTVISRDPAYEHTERCRLENRLELQAMAEADVGIAISEGLKDHFVEAGIAADRLFVVPNGVDPNAYEPAPRDARLASRLGLGDDDTVVGYVGSLLDYEGIDLVLSAVAQLRGEGLTKLKALIVGTGRTGDQLPGHAHSLGISDACIFCGAVPREEVQSYYSLIDIAPFARKLQPVTKLVPPLKPMEAMAMARATIVSDLPALAEIGEDGLSVVHVRHDNVAALADAIGALARDPDRRRALGEAGREWVLKERSLGAIGTRLGAAYEALGIKVSGAELG